MEGTKKGVSTRLLLLAFTLELVPNDLSLHRQSANLFMYADDHQIYISDNEILKATQTLRRQIEAVWYKENLLQANPQKY